MRPAANTATAWSDRLEELGLAVRHHLRALTARGAADLADPVADEGGDTIYRIDRHVEPVLEQVIASWPASCKPLLLIAEGLGPDGLRRFGPEGTPLQHRLLVDPIDGTRGLMYDKRSAWFLAALAPDRGEGTSLADTVAAVAVELPTSKQGWADAFVAVAGRPTVARRAPVAGGAARTFVPRPSTATTLRDGYAQVASFFPGTKVLAAQLMERIVEATVGRVRPGKADVFDDQYISTGGQMAELMLGHDRFCCDLRPLFYDILARQTGQSVRGLQCHPYDVAGALVARQAGVVLTDGFGRPLDCPLDVRHGVHWCGYANRALADLVQPVIAAWLAEHGVVPPRH